jgi:hypothetical protein
MGYNGMEYVNRLLYLNLLPLTYVREISDMILMYNIINNRLDVNIDRYFIKADNIRRGRSITAGINLKQYRYKTEQGKHFYNNRAIVLWNHLPDYIRGILPPAKRSSKPTRFKIELHKFYMDKLTNEFDVHSLCTWQTYCDCNICRLA